MVKNFDKTYKKNLKRIVALEERMEELGIDYDGFLDSHSWSTIETQAHRDISLTGENARTKRELAKIINYHTREAIIGSLKYHEMPKSWDTAFFIAHYNKTVEGMVEILENFIDRGEVK